MCCAADAAADAELPRDRRRRADHQRLPTANTMTEPTLDDLVSEAGLDASLADAFRSEDVTVEILLNSSLTERREVLRAMNQSFGVILALNRVLESYRPASNGETNGGKDDEDDVEPVPIEEPPPAPEAYPTNTNDG